ncbi:MAG: PfkB family carbohydrate kinase, partial [Chloroflexota bacterium]
EGSPSGRAKRLLGPEPGSRAVLVTLGASGALLVAGRRARAVHAPRVDAVDSVGAGDTFNGALAAALADGLDLATAARRAVVAASLAVTRAGAREGMPSTEELERALAD